jgi:hypothetical protein
MLEAGKRHPEMIEPVLQRLSGDGDAKLSHIGEVRQPQPAGKLLLPERLQSRQRLRFRPFLSRPQPSTRLEPQCGHFASSSRRRFRRRCTSSPSPRFWSTAISFPARACAPECPPIAAKPTHSSYRAFAFHPFWPCDRRLLGLPFPRLEDRESRASRPDRQIECCAGGRVRRDRSGRAAYASQLARRRAHEAQRRPMARLVSALVITQA